MFEVAELGLKLTKREFEAKVPELHTKLLQAQQALRESGRALIIIVSGVEGAGKGEVVNRLNEWFDTRGISTNAFWDETDEQALRPPYWRYWRALPARGSIGILFGSWYTRPIVERAYKRIDEAKYERLLQEIAAFERMLVQDGAIVVKLWYHMPKTQVEKQLKADVKDPRYKMRSSPFLKRFGKLYDRFLAVSQVALTATDLDESPWQIIEASDVHYRDYTTGQHLLDILRQQLAAGAPPGLPVSGKRKSTPEKQTVLEVIDLARKLDEKNYEKRLRKWQNTLHQLAWTARDRRRSLVLVFEGWDAAGKGSIIRRVTRAIDARLYKVISSAAPTDEEAAQHYLWRFWRNVPLAGYHTIYDRSWYGRVLVERVEQFAREDEWRRAYGEINLFEQQLVEHGIVVLKFWLHISPEEQLRRFRERETTPWKSHKISGEDWRNRDKWHDYEQAVNDMVAHTSTALAPWHLIPVEDKKYARVEVLRTVCKTLKKSL